MILNVSPVSVGHLNIFFFFFGKMSIQVLPPFLVALFGFFFLFTVELHEFVFSNLANYR